MNEGQTKAVLHLLITRRITIGEAKRLIKVVEEEGGNPFHIIRFRSFRKMQIRPSRKPKDTFFTDHEDQVTSEEDQVIIKLGT